MSPTQLSVAPVSIRHRGRTVPLCVDLDETLLRGNMLWECLVALLRQRPWCVLMVLLWLLQGRARLKAELAARVEYDVSLLPYDPDVVAFLMRAKEDRRPVILVTGAARAVAEAIARHLKLFDEVLASDGRTNLTGTVKAAALVAEFGPQGFDYIGNGWGDLKAFAACRHGYVVNASRLVNRRAQALGARRLGASTPWRSLRALLRAIRVHQWAKNVLVFVPVITAHRVTDSGDLSHAVLAFLSFSCCASSAYVLNDLVDLPSDRQTSSKARRPFAAGLLPLWTAGVLVPGLLTLALLLATVLPPDFRLWLLLYFSGTLLYSLGLKRLAVLDGVVLAALYAMRLQAGAVAIDVQISKWLLAFAIFIFFSLALMKRYAELAARAASAPELPGRGYAATDLQFVLSFGSASGLMAVLVLALYVSHPDVAGLYHRPGLLWSLCPILLYWISRMWFRATRGVMPDDPVVFALRDAPSYALGLLTAGIMIAAT